MLRLRPYQEAAKQAVYDYLHTRDDNPCVVIPTGGGKTPVIASICKDVVTQWKGQVIVFAHVKELLEQIAVKLQAICPEVPFGIYSAGLKRRDRTGPVLVAGIQSVWRRVDELDTFDLVIVDEAHLIPADGDGMYRTFLAAMKDRNPQVRLVGFTATPYRLDSGTICGPDKLLQAICYEVGVRELIVQGYLCPLVNKASVTKVDTSTLHVRGGEFVADEVEDLMDDDEIVEAACNEIVERTQNRQSVLIFASGIRHGKHVVQMLQEKHGVECGFVTGDTPSAERQQLIARFRRVSGEEPLKYICNVNVLTTGFDAPNVDCVVLLRPTLSPGLYYQMVGRGFRTHPGKDNCLVLDFGGNVLRHGTVDRIHVRDRNSDGSGEAPVKECAECHSVVAASYVRCPDCGHLFPQRNRVKHAPTASDAPILSGQVTETEYEVWSVHYYVHHKRGAPEDAPKSMRVDYKVGFTKYVSEWICFEHEGYPRKKAIEWWKQRSHAPVPDTAEEAVALAQHGQLAPTKKIKVRSVSGEKFDRIVGYELGEIPNLQLIFSADWPEDALDFPFGYNVIPKEDTHDS